MKRSGKIALIAAAAFVLLGLLLILVSMVLGVNPDRLEDQVEDYFEGDMVGVTVVEHRDGGYDRWESYESSNLYEVETHNIRSLQVDWAAGRVEITPWEEDYIQIAEVANREITEAEALRWRVDDHGNLFIRDEEKQSGIVLNRSAKSLQVMIPAELAENWQTLRVDAASASVHIRDMSAVKLHVDTASGDVELENMTAQTAVVRSTSGAIRFSGSYDQLKAESTSGDVTVESLAAPRSTEIDTNSGKIEVRGDCGALSLESTSGDITAIDVTAWGVSADANSAAVKLELLTCPRELDVETTSGDVTLTLPADSGFRLEFDHGSGDLERCDLSLSRERGRYIAGDGRGDFSVETNSGDLFIYSQ